jgi:hypothetical protein
MDTICYPCTVYTVQCTWVPYRVLVHMHAIKLRDDDYVEYKFYVYSSCSWNCQQLAAHQLQPKQPVQPIRANPLAFGICGDYSSRKTDELKYNCRQNYSEFIEERLTHLAKTTLSLRLCAA